MKRFPAKVENPIRDLISDEIFDLLYYSGYLSETGIRNYLIRKKYKQLKQNKVRAIVAIFNILDEYSYLKYDTIRKIVYR